VQVNYFGGRDAYAAGRDIIIFSPHAASFGPVVVGNIPRQPAAFQVREDLLAQLRSAGLGVSAVHAVTGMRGAGKSQLAAAYARECVAAGWRLVAWVDAEDTAQVLACLAVVADRLGISQPGDDLEASGQRVRSWLEADGYGCLVVFDNVGDPGTLRRYLPAAGRSRVVLTGAGIQGLGRPVRVGVFAEDEALAFLAERTGRDDPDGARALTRALGCLPLALAQAAAVIVAAHLSFKTYLARLQAVPLRDYLPRAKGDPYPYGLAETILLCMDAVAAEDPTGLSRDLLDLVAMLSPAGIAREVLSQVSHTDELNETADREQVDEALGRLADASLVSFDGAGDTVLVHPLVARVARERHSHAGTLADLATRACALLENVTGSIHEPRQNRLAAHEAVTNITALYDQLPGDVRSEAPLAGRLLDLRGWALRCLLELGDNAPLAIEMGERLVRDSDRLRGEEDPQTLTLRGYLGTAYRAAGRAADAVAALERALTVQERLLGPDHPNTLVSRNNLGLAYQDAGRLGEAIRMLEQARADSQRVLGEDHPNTLVALNNLASAYRLAGRQSNAIPLLERAVAGRERIYGEDHPGTLASRANLASAYQDAGRLAEAIPLFERALAAQERVLGPDHPDTLASRNNLAGAYQAAGRLAEAIPLLEQSLAGLEQTLGEDNPRTILVRRNLADARSAAGSPARVLIVGTAGPGERDAQRRIARALESRHLEVIDVNTAIRPGERVASRLQELAQSADVVLVMITSRGLGLGSAWTELESTMSGRVRESIVIPVFVGEAAQSVRLPYELATRQGIRLDGRSEKEYDEAARQVAAAVADRRQVLPSGGSLPGRPDGRLPAAQLDATVELVREAFLAAGRQLRQGSQPQLFEPGPVWISAEIVPSTDELDRFGLALPSGQPGYFVHIGDLPRSVSGLVDHMRVGGKKVVTVSVRALQAALAAGEARIFLDELEQLYGSRDNLFDTKNALIDDRFLFGRDAMLTRIGSAIGRDEHVLISGLRKAGKTSLLNILRQHLVGYPVCLADLQRFDRHGEDWPPVLFAMMVEAVDRWGKIGRTEWPFHPASPVTATQLARELDRRFAYLGTDPAKRRVVVMLDEIERVFPRRAETKARRQWVRAAGALRVLAQGGTRSVVVIGADLRPTANRENDLGNGETNPFFSFFQEIPVALLDHDATGDMLESLARAMGVSTVHKEFIDQIFAMTGGHPSLARTIAAEAYRERADPGRLGVADLESGLATLDETDSVGSFIRNNLWEPMTVAEKQILTDFARRRTPRALGNKRRPDVARTEGYASLRSQGIIGDRAIRVGLLKEWVQDYGGAGVS
jgi:tetratricopeptide (TPR) repeat protein